MSYNNPEKPVLSPGEHIEPLGEGRALIVNEIHRFGTDAFLLASFTSPRRREACVDLGTGCGIIPALWVSDGCGKSVLGIDISEEACSLARRSVEMNGDSDIVSIRNIDLRRLAESDIPREAFHCVACNPPYFVESSGYVAPDPERAAARCERSCSIDDVLDAAKYLLRYGGRLCMCHRPERLADVICSMRSHGIEPKRLRLVHQKPGSRPWLVLIEGKRGGASSLEILPPLNMLDPDGNSSDEIESMYAEYRKNAGYTKD